MAKRFPTLGLFGRFKLFWLIYRDRRTPWWAKVALTGLALIYIIWPWDAIPIIVPVLGVVDDLVVTTFLMWLITRAAPAVVRQQHRLQVQRDRGDVAEAGSAVDDDGPA